MELREGMFFTVEPMINAGKYQVKVLEDGWTAVTRDRSLSAQFEHNVAVTADSGPSASSGGTRPSGSIHPGNAPLGRCSRTMRSAKSFARSSARASAVRPCHSRSIRHVNAASTT